MTKASLVPVLLALKTILISSPHVQTSLVGKFLTILALCDQAFDTADCLKKIQ